MESFVCPITKKTLIFTTLPYIKLMPGRYQRELSTTFSGKMSKSMVNGFLVPILVTPVDDEHYEVIDGQHRLYTMGNLGCQPDTLIPCVVLPPEYRDLPLIYNIEKDDNIKDICTKLYHLYIDHVENNPDETEMDLQSSALGQPYYITLAVAHREKGLESPSMVESVVKKLDRDFLPVELSEALDVRRVMADQVKALDLLVAETAGRYHITDYNLKKSIISKTSMDLWGRTRNLSETFDEGMDKIMAAIKSTDWSWMAGR